MVNKDIILAKVSQIQNCLKRIKQKMTGKNPKETLKDFDLQDIIVINLQRAIQSAIDVAAHIVADQGLGLPSSIRENFVLLDKAKIIDQQLSQQMQKMVGFRNIAVHDYTAIDELILQKILLLHIEDLKHYCTTILTLVA